MSYRPKIMKLAKIIGGLPGMLHPIDENSPEYYSLASILSPPILRKNSSVPSCIRSALQVIRTGLAPATRTAADRTHPISANADSYRTACPSPTRDIP